MFLPKVSYWLFSHTHNDLSSSPDIYLFDDPLSALDLKVASKLIETIATSDRLKNKTFVFSTNNPSYIKYADKIIYLKEGGIQYQGSYTEFKASKFYEMYISAAKNQARQVRNPKPSPKTNSYFSFSSFYQRTLSKLLHLPQNSKLT